MAQTSSTQAKVATGARFVAVASPSKVEVNKWLFQLATSHHDRRDEDDEGKKSQHEDDEKSEGGGRGRGSSGRWILTLESEALTTFNTFISQQSVETSSSSLSFKANQFVVPNPDAGICETVASAGAIPLCATSHQVLADLKNKSGANYDHLVSKGWPGFFDFIWLDYCGTLDSKAGKMRKEDISIVIQNRLLASDGGVLAVTISERGGAQPYKHAVVDELVEHIDGERLLVVKYNSSSDSLQRKPPPSISSQGIACYTSVESVAGRRPLSLVTGAWKTEIEQRRRNQRQKEEEEGDSTPSKVDQSSTVIAPPEAKELTFTPDWKLYGNVQDGSLPLLKAMDICAERFVQCLRQMQQRQGPSSVVSAGAGDQVLVLDSKLAPATRALIRSSCDSGEGEEVVEEGGSSGGLVIHSTVELQPDLQSAKFSSAAEMEKTPQTTAKLCWADDAGLYRLLSNQQQQTNAPNSTTAEQGETGISRGGNDSESSSFDGLKRFCAVWLDYERHRVFTATELLASGRPIQEVTEGNKRWKDLDYLFSTGVLKYQKGSSPQLLGVCFKVTDSKIIWEGADVDWLLSGLGTALRRHASLESGEASVGEQSLLTVRCVARFTVPPATRICVIVQLGEREEEKSTTSLSTSPRVDWKLPSNSSPHSSWKATTSWDFSRPKTPTNAATKFQMVSMHVDSVIHRHGIEKVVLEEPGFHWVLPQLRKRSGLEVDCTVFEDADLVQREEVLRKAQRDSCIRLVEPDEIINGQSEESTVMGTSSSSSSSVGVGSAVESLVARRPHALVLLGHLGSSTWEKRWLPSVEKWLKNRSQLAKAFNTPQWCLIAVLVVDDPKDDSTSQLYGKLCEVCQNTSSLSSSSSFVKDQDVVEHHVFSLATNHRYWWFRVWLGGSDDDGDDQASSKQEVEGNGWGPSSTTQTSAGNCLELIGSETLLVANQKGKESSSLLKRPEWPAVNLIGKKGKTPVVERSSE